VSDRGLQRITAALVAILLGTAVVFRLLHLGTMPGIDGDEGWWGVQATRWLHGQPFEARTTSGNPIDMILLVPLGLAHALAPPSFTLLRLVPSVLNLMGLAIGFFLVRRLYGRETAWMQTVALAVLPTAIAHSRLCQDPSQSIPWTALVVYLSLLSLKERSRAWPYAIATVVVFAVAVRTHPTNIFIAPFALLPYITIVPSTKRARTIFFTTTALIIVAAIAAAIVWLARAAGSIELLDKPWLSTAVAHLTRPSNWLEFVVNYGRLFDGVVVYHYLSDPHLVSVASDLGFCLVAPLVLWGMWLTLSRHRSAVDGALVIAWTAMIGLFFVVAGPEALRPNFERWGLCLIAPATVIVARGIAGWLDAKPRLRAWTICASAAVAGGLLGAFYLDFFRVFETTGGRAHVTLVTARPEPKQQALDHVLATRAGTEPVIVAAQQWWLYWPIAYLAQVHPGVRMSTTLAVEDRRDFAEMVDGGRVFIVEFTGSAQLAKAQAWIQAQGLRSTTTVVRDAGGRDLLHVLQVSASDGRTR